MAPVSTHRPPSPAVAALREPALSLRLLLVAALACALTLLGGSPAQAHAQLVRSSPDDGATLAAVPPEVALTFNEEVNPDFVTVTVSGDTGQASTGEPEVDGDTVYQGLDPRMEQGDYTIAYKVTSADGHPVSGTLSFTYASSGEERDAGAPAATSSDASGEDGESEPSQDGSASEGDGETSGSAEATGEEPSDPSETSATSESPESSESSESSTSSEDSSDEPSTSATSTDSAEATETADDAAPWWLWLLVALGALALIGGLITYLARRGDRDADYDLRSDRYDDGEPDVRRLRDDDPR
ncbi:hypothetical protein GCM10022199_15290 [Marihabitans asiaticum]|uniref:Methionine-rich copper-binding protein CopC n=1 Tax=Marihabitans asiaticum TaxID=415218 RepID=A0A560W839_9MICO|nr:methionine-rich copper-binding protein CopC [Marihabitans asiaticum]